MEKLVCIQDFCDAALEKLDKVRGEYFKSGADDEITANDNRNAFHRWLIRPRMLRDVSRRDLSTVVLGKTVSFPVGVSPMAFQRTAHPDGECASAKAAEAAGGIFTLSIFATSSIEEIASVAPKGRKWMQLFVHKDSLANVAPNTAGAQLDFSALHGDLDHGLTWPIIKWLKGVTKLPIVVKGIQTGEDALMAVNEGADAVWISNHGGRQIDTASATIDVLPEIVRAVKKRCEIYIDGGITRGSDIFKALALGANMVFIGRAMIWGIVVGGAEGAEKCLEILREEFDLTMALSGVSSVKDITAEYVVPGSISRL